MTKPVPGRDRRSAARLAAVQALYQSEVGEVEIDGVIAQFREHGAVLDDAPALKFDGDLFAELAAGAAARRAELDESITAALAPGWTMDRLELLLRAVLRVGAYEMMARPSTPAKVVINEYIEIAHAFFDQGVPGLVNGVLDRLARELREAEFTAVADPD